MHAVIKADAGDMATGLKHRLDVAGMPVTSIAPAEPSLEDVFLELVERAS